MPSRAIAFEEQPMTLDYVLGAIFTFGIIAYLVFALLKPEKL